MSDQRCPACGAATVTETNLFQGGAGRQCQACGLVWSAAIGAAPERAAAAEIGTQESSAAQVSAAPSAAPSKEIYDSAYDAEQGGFKWHAFLDYHRRLKGGEPPTLNWFEKEFLKSHPAPRGGRLLEVGCGVGRFLVAARNAGWQVAGLDISRKAVELARDLLPEAEIQPAVIEEAGWPDATFDAIVMWEVIEHVPDPAAMVRAASRMLRPGGLLAVSTPDWGSWAIRRHPALNYWPPYHVWFFSQQPLTAILQQAGLDVLSIRRNRFPWSETRWPLWKRQLLLPWLYWRGVIRGEGGGRLVMVARKP